MTRVYLRCMTDDSPYDDLPVNWNSLDLETLITPKELLENGRAYGVPAL